MRTVVPVDSAFTWPFYHAILLDCSKHHYECWPNWNTIISLHNIKILRDILISNQMQDAERAYKTHW